MGLIGQVLVPVNTRPDLMARYSGSELPSSPDALGVTGGQLIDVYVYDRLVPDGVLADDFYVIELERAADGMTVDHDMGTAPDYYAGCIFTMLSGPAAGQSARIVESQVVEYVDQTLQRNGNNITRPRPIVRLRMMVFGQSDGSPLNVRGASDPNRSIELAELVASLSDQQGHAFMVNGRAHNGTGVGYNRLAATGTPRLNAVELATTPSGVIGSEVALTPNAQFVVADNVGVFGGGPDPFSISGATLADFQLLNLFDPVRNQYVSQLYPTAEGPGGSDESYDAVDYQNMFLAYVPVTPRARGGLLLDNNGTLQYLSGNLTDQEFNNAISAGIPCRLDLENTIIPSFHRPALFNYWYNRLHRDGGWLATAVTDLNERAAGILMPYGEDYQRGTSDDPDLGNLSFNDFIAGLKRKISLRPIPEDHPSFDGTNPLSRYSGTFSPADPNVRGYARPKRHPFPHLGGRRSLGRRQRQRWD